MSSSTAERIDQTLDARNASKREGWRFFKDRWARYLMAVGGVSVIVAILLIFFYLIYVVWPLFESAAVTVRSAYRLPGGAGGALHLATEEHAELGLRVTEDGRLVFFRLEDGALIGAQPLPLTAGQRISAIGKADPSRGTLAAGLSDGSALVFKVGYRISYPEDRRLITPELELPLGPIPIPIDPSGRPLRAIALQASEDSTMLAAISDSDSISLVRLSRSRSALDDTVSRERSAYGIPVSESRPDRLLLDPTQRSLFVATEDGFIHYYDVGDTRVAHLIDRVSVVPRTVQVTALELLSGGISLLVGDTRGRITQWFPVRGEDKRYALARVRSFRAQKAPILAIAPEHYRKGFAALDAEGYLGLYHTTAHRTLLVQRITQPGLRQLAMAPRADTVLAEHADGRLQVLSVRNEHPEVSWGSLWERVWYESREHPEFIWQSSSASSDFEPKMSLTPLTLGTLKAALYAMLFAVPIAVLGAIYTGYFMAPGMRGLVKPSIEIMGALPTVILGFLAGLWLAPLIEQHLMAVFTLLIVTPVMMVLAAWLWSQLPEALRLRVPDGWEAALLVPFIGLAYVVSVVLSGPLEALLFGGDVRNWITAELGLAVDQRNSLVVGIAMGVAVIPTIFSISEDAIFGVPRHLTLGSLALGATPWQTLTRVVLLTASPGIFSALMIGLGRAVGETMIVLMATGNTPVMDLNIFQGFRALSANIAVELPESELNSTHYRVLFLAALVLFLVTFLVNTGAELVRQRLRARYSNL